ncbi:hypothetical protein AM1_B0321 (plasmid) [Acaryochloris marina MBIC11017]|uniref:Uncharacterized protein n=1 Tax=Acaryochloris marina (strain MBIC 11017) TaxID=329726 RepID=A8ZLL3_ACAM1|nr:hypothetical protein AM1_B0321 [Acaryochloris marina MBIC11017]
MRSFKQDSRKAYLHACMQAGINEFSFCLLATHLTQTSVARFFE